VGAEFWRSGVAGALILIDISPAVTRDFTVLLTGVLPMRSRPRRV
jgi:hypothetical protein